METININELKASESKYKKASGIAGQGVLSVVATKKSRNSLSISEEVIEELGSPEYVSIYLDQEGVIIKALDSDSETGFRLRKQKRKSLIYCKELVEEIVGEFELDFSGGRTSITFQDFDYLQLEDESKDEKEVVAKIFLRNRKEEPGSDSEQ